mmetsp:Transcript_47192/g.69923  ORF Transcript_47192/g.69923 Transcript_47192/m.69923 type:complete len:91 (-) Transcript_47192:171-443(-)
MTVSIGSSPQKIYSVSSSVKYSAGENFEFSSLSGPQGTRNVAVAGTAPVSDMAGALKQLAWLRHSQQAGLVAHHCQQQELKCAHKTWLAR